jgi:hypothetical protein
MGYYPCNIHERGGFEGMINADGQKKEWLPL